MSALSYEEVGVVTAKGDGAYEFTDHTPVTGMINYYRIKSIDINGNVHYSATVMINADNAIAGGLQAFPNPATDHVTLSGDLSGKVSGTITDLRGRTVQEFTATTTGNAVGVSLNELPKGIYLITINTGSKKLTTKLIKD